MTNYITKFDLNPFEYAFVYLKIILQTTAVLWEGEEHVMNEKIVNI